MLFAHSVEGQTLFSNVNENTSATFYFETECRFKEEICTDGWLRAGITKFGCGLRDAIRRRKCPVRLGGRIQICATEKLGRRVDRRICTQ